LAEAELALSAGAGVVDWRGFHALARTLCAAEGNSRVLCTFGHLPRDQYLDCGPVRYYFIVRLTRARQFLLQTKMPIADATLACDFVSDPNCSRRYRDLFGVPSSQEPPTPVSVRAAAEAHRASATL
jgi:AraC-like DNA-binding protein